MKRRVASAPRRALRRFKRTVKSLPVSHLVETARSIYGLETGPDGALYALSEALIPYETARQVVRDELARRIARTSYTRRAA